MLRTIGTPKANDSFLTRKSMKKISLETFCFKRDKTQDVNMREAIVRDVLRFINWATIAPCVTRVVQKYRQVNIKCLLQFPNARLMKKVPFQISTEYFVAGYDEWRQNTFFEIFT